MFQCLPKFEYCGRYGLWRCAFYREGRIDHRMLASCLAALRSLTIHLKPKIELHKIVGSHRIQTQDQKCWQPCSSKFPRQYPQLLLLFASASALDRLEGLVLFLKQSLLLCLSWGPLTQKCEVVEDATINRIVIIEPKGCRCNYNVQQDIQ